MSRKKAISFDFEEIFKRIKGKTGIDNATKLAEIVDVSSSAIYQARKENKFHLDWIYLVSVKFKLSFEWLTQGEEPIKPEDEENKKLELDFLLDVEEWIKNERRKEPDYLPWFRLEFLKKFPEFAEWKRKVDSEQEDSLAQEQKIA